MKKRKKQGNIQKIKRLELPVSTINFSSAYLFEPGIITVSPVVQKLNLSQHGLIDSVLTAHCTGVWLHDDPHDVQINNDNIQRGAGDVMSIHISGHIEIWVKTILNRGTTWIGTPDEYF